MQICVVVLAVMLCGMSLTACTPLPKSFTPHTPEEQAVVRTIDSFLSAWRAHDRERLAPLVLQEAAMDAFVDGSPLPPARILALPQRADGAALWQATADRLVDFRQSSPRSVSVGTYVHDVVQVDRGSDEVTTLIRWDLVQESGTWRIQHMTQTTWVHPWDIRAGGA